MKKLTVEELAGVVNIYPWFGAARAELCGRLGAEGCGSDGGRLLSESALYVPCRRRLSAIIAADRVMEHQDADVEALLRLHSEGRESASGQMEETSGSGNGREVRIVGGDYFSQADYDEVKRKGDSELFRNIARQDKVERDADRPVPVHLGLYTVTLAEIYAVQVYSEEAKSIYSQLILAYPEKSAYFASLIEKLG